MPRSGLLEPSPLIARGETIRDDQLVLGFHTTPLPSSSRLPTRSPRRSDRHHGRPDLVHRGPGMGAVSPNRVTASPSASGRAELLCVKIFC
jgi:hypothetical protein